MLIIAHRGAKATHPENTISAMQAALDAGCTAIEFDVHQHDGEFWVIHDKWVNRTTNGVGRLNWFNKEALKELNAGDNERIPTLKEVLAFLQGRCAINIELKGINDFELFNLHLEWALTRYEFKSSQIMVTAFKHQWLQQLRAINPSVLLGALTSNQPTTLAEFTEELDVVSININIDVADKAFIDDAKNRGLQVYIFTVNQHEDWQTLNTMGVNGVFCDNPKAAIAVFPEQPKVSWIQ